MANTIRVVGVADMASMNAEFGKSSVALTRLGETANAAFTEMSAGALKAQLAADKLAVSLARVPEGSTAAAAAFARYNGELEALAVSQTAAAREIGSALTRYITVPTALIGVAAVKLATDFQSSMLRIQTQAGASTKEVQNMSAAVLNLAKNGAQQGPNALAGALYPIESVGIRGAKALDALTVASKAAALGNASLSDVSDVLAAAIKTDIKGTQDFQQAMGTLNATVGAGKMTMQDLAGALGTGILVNAKLVGLSLDQVGAALDVLVDRGMPAQQAATRLGATFKLMLDPSGPAVKALASLGIGASQLADDLRQPNGLLKALDDLRAGYEALGPVAGAQALSASFGRSRQSTAIIALVEGLDSYIQKLQQVHDTSSKLNQDEILQSQTASASFHRDLAQMEADLTQLGTTMLPTVTAVVNGITKIGNAFSALPSPIKTEIGAIVLLLAAGGPLLLAVTGVINATKKIGTMFGTAATETTVATTTIEGDIAAVGATSAIASANVGTLSKGLIALKNIGPIVVGVTVAETILQSKPYKKGQSWIDKNLGPFGVLFDSLPNLVGQTGQAFKNVYDYIAGGGSNKISDADAQKLVPLIESGVVKASNIEALKSRLSPQMYTSLLGLTNYYATGNPHDRPFDALSGIGALAYTPLTPAQLQAIGLAENPNNPKLLAQERSQIQGTIDWLTRRFHEGKISSAEYTAQVVKLETQLHSIGVKSTTGRNKAAAELRKKAAAAAKKQREYASGVSTTATDLKTTVDRYKTLPAGPHGNLPTKLTAADDDLIAYYEQEAKDANLTKAERARYAALAVQARQQEAAQAQRDADVYERTAVDTAKAAYQRVRRLKGDIAAKEEALRGEISALSTAIHDKRLTPAERATFIESRGTAQGELTQLKNTYVAPLSIQLGLAKDTAMHDYTGMYAMALEEKKAALRAIKSGALGIQGMIDAWNVIDQANQTLQNWVVFKTVKSSAESLTAGLNLSTSTRKALEMRIAQSQAHGGRLPTYEGVQGVAVPIHTHVLIDGREIATVVTAHQIKQTRHRPIQTRGLHAGT